MISCGLSRPLNEFVKSHARVVLIRHIESYLLSSYFDALRAKSAENMKVVSAQAGCGIAPISVSYRYHALEWGKGCQSVPEFMGIR
jgi:hypothetical protein